MGGMRRNRGQATIAGDAAPGGPFGVFPLCFRRHRPNRKKGWSVRFRLAPLWMLGCAVMSPALAGQSGLIVSPGLSVYVFDETNNALEPGLGLNLSAGYQVNPRLAIEASVTGFSSDNRNTGDDEDTLVTDFSARYYANPSSYLRPYLVGGLGRFDSDHRSLESGAQWGFGGGLELLDVDRQSGVRAELRARYKDDDENWDYEARLQALYRWDWNLR